MRGNFLRTIGVGFCALTDTQNLNRDLEFFPYMRIIPNNDLNIKSSNFGLFAQTHKSLAEMWIFCIYAQKFPILNDLYNSLYFGQ